MRVPACRDELHGEQGPFHWALERLMSMGRRSLGVAAATSLRFCKLLVDNPWAAPFYADELHELLLFDPKTDNLPGHVVHFQLELTDTFLLTQITCLCYLS